MPIIIEARLTPAEISRLPGENLTDCTCVVFDILRATSVFTTALASGAISVRPVAEIADALATRRADPSVLLAGERNGLRLQAHATDGVDFDLGNSPREFTPQAVSGRKIVSTTTNGTRALRACAGAGRVLATSFLNLSATANYVARLAPPRIVLVCAGTGERLALEDVLAAGAFCRALEVAELDCRFDDSAEVAKRMFIQSESQLAKALANSQNGRRLAGIPELQADIGFCAQRDTAAVVIAMNADGELVKA